MATTGGTPLVFSRSMAPSSHRRSACAGHVVAWRRFAGVRCGSVPCPIRWAHRDRDTCCSADRGRTFSGVTCSGPGRRCRSASWARAPVHGAAVYRSRWRRQLNSTATVCVAFRESARSIRAGTECHLVRQCCAKRALLSGAQRLRDTRFCLSRCCRSGRVGVRLSWSSAGRATHLAPGPRNGRLPSFPSRRRPDRVPVRLRWPEGQPCLWGSHIHRRAGYSE